MMLGVFCWSQQGPHVNLESIFKGDNLHWTCYRPLCLLCFLKDNDVQMRECLFQELLANFQLHHWHLHTVDFSILSMYGTRCRLNYISCRHTLAKYTHPCNSSTKFPTTLHNYRYLHEERSNTFLSSSLWFFGTSFYFISLCLYKNMSIHIDLIFLCMCEQLILNVLIHIFFCLSIYSDQWYTY